MWRAVHPYLNKKKLLKKKKQKQISHNHSYSITSETTRKREKNWVWKEKKPCVWSGSWYQVRIVCFCFQEEELSQLLHPLSQHLQKIPLFLCLDIVHPSSFFYVTEREKRREEKREERERRGFFLGFEKGAKEKRKRERKKGGENRKKRKFPKRLSRDFFSLFWVKGLKKNWGNQLEFRNSKPSF